MGIRARWAIFLRLKAVVQTVLFMISRQTERSFALIATVRAEWAVESGTAEEILLGFGVLYRIGFVPGVGRGLLE